MGGEVTSGAGTLGGEACPGAAQTCIPAAVIAVLEAKCQGCHSDPPAMFAPMPLLTWEDFQGMHAAAQEPNYKRTALRVRSELSPMPPIRSPQLSVQERATLLDWVDRGAPSGP